MFRATVSTSTKRLRSKQKSTAFAPRLVLPKLLLPPLTSLVGVKS